MENKNTPIQTEALQKMTPVQWLLRLLQGAIIGAGAVLPGISGGVLCVIFGIYQPMMELLAHPFKMFKKYYMMFIPILLGVAADSDALLNAGAAYIGVVRGPSVRRPVEDLITVAGQAA